MPKAELESLVEKGLKELAFEDTYLVEVKHSGKKIEIYLDSDEGVGFSTCQKLSRWMELHLDKAGTFGDNYTLEVSSAGIGNPLKLLRQYPKNIGRVLDVRYGESGHAKGVLTGVSDEGMISVEFEKVVKENNKNKKVKVTEVIKFEDIIESRIKISFN